MAMGFTPSSTLATPTAAFSLRTLTPKSNPPAAAVVIGSSSATNTPKELCLVLSVSQEDGAQPRPTLLLGRRHGLCACFAALTFSFSGGGSACAAILEADDDEELLERVKKDREKRIQRQGVIRSSDKETGYLQELVYKLSKVGQAIEKNDFSAASSVLAPRPNTDWVQNANIAFAKLSSSPEEKMEVDTFNSSLSSLILSVDKHDVESSKLAFVSSASALEKWVGLTGLVGQLKGL